MNAYDIHAIIYLAERAAIAIIKDQRRRRGGKISLLATEPTIKAQALRLLEAHPELYAQARAKWEAETKIKLAQTLPEASRSCLLIPLHHVEFVPY